VIKNGLMRNLRKDLLFLGISQDEFHFKYSKEKGDVEDDNDICLLLHSFKIHGSLGLTFHV